MLLAGEQVSMACTGPVGGLARAPLKMIATVPQTREMLRAAMAEVVAVAASQGVSLDSNLEGALDRYANGPVSPTCTELVHLSRDPPCLSILSHDAP